MEDITHHQMTYRHDSYTMFLVTVDVELNGPSGRMMEFSDGPCFVSTVFPVAVFSGICFLNLVHFPPTFNPYLCHVQ